MKELTPETVHGIVNRVTETTFNYHGWPSVCRDARGTLYAAASGMRLGHVDPTGKNCMYVSFNEGKTWSPPIVVNDSYLDDRDTGIIAWGEGKMLMSFFNDYDDQDWDSPDWSWLPDQHKPLYKGYTKSLEHVWNAKGYHGSFVKMSDDWGVTWSDKVRVPVTSPHGPVMLRDGTLVYMGKVMDPEYLAPNPICVYSSHDGGYTWEKTGEVEPSEDITNENMHEPHMIELPNGRLLGSIRIHGRQEQPDFTVYITYSDDKGKTWSKPFCIGVDGSPPHLMVHSSGAVICSYSRRRSPEDRGEYAAVSYDNGETWTENYALRTDIAYGDHGYPASVELSDGSIMTVYYMGNPGDWWTSVLYTKWRLGDK